MTLVPLGDQALLAYCADEPAAVRLAVAARLAAMPWLHDVVPAYASVGFFFDAEHVTPAAVSTWVKRVARTANRPATPPGRTHAIPVCYEIAADMTAVAFHLNMSPDRVVALHTEAVYVVHAIGFVPGFAYLGYLPPALAGVPRLETPRVRTEAGSVGLTGRQTGVYPQMVPGGWPIIGRTPLTLVDVAAGYFPLRVGDRVQFVSISRKEFDGRTGERLQGDDR